MPDFNQIDEAINAFVREQHGRIAPVKIVTMKSSGGPLEVTMPGTYNVYGNTPGFGSLFIKQLTARCRWVARMGTDSVLVYKFSEINIRGLENVNLRVTYAPPSNQLLVEADNA